jgi:hypothetical protein
MSPLMLSTAPSSLLTDPEHMAIERSSGASSSMKADV